MIPLVLDLSGRRVMIFGGGDVGARKAVFFEGRADVHVVSRSFSPTFDGIGVTRQRLDLRAVSDDDLRTLLSGVFLAVGATRDPALNDRIGQICRGMEILYNNADGEAGDVIIPSEIAGSNYCLAITTFGKSPAVPRFVRKKLEQHLAGLDEMIEVQAALRSQLKTWVPSQEKRASILWSVLEDAEIWDLAIRNRENALKTAVERYVDA